VIQWTVQSAEIYIESANNFLCDIQPSEYSIFIMIYL
jgi:hypothetical protein